MKKQLSLSHGRKNIIPRLWVFVWVLMVGVACTMPAPAPHNIPTSPAIIEITPAPTLDVDATATVLASQARPTPTPAGLYIVQEGDTLIHLAEEFDTTVEEIMAANGLTDPNAIQLGQALIIPSLLQAPVVNTPPPASNE